MNCFPLGIPKPHDMHKLIRYKPLKLTHLAIFVFLCSSLAFGQQDSAQSPIEQFLHHRMMGVDAFKRSEIIEAREHFEKAIALQPDSGATLLLMAQTYFQANNLDQARHYLSLFLNRGLVFTELQLKTLSTAITPEMKDLNAANARPRGTMDTIASIDGPKLIEALYVDKTTNNLTFTCIHTGTVESIPHTLSAAFVDGEAPFGICMHKDRMWISTSTTPFAKSHNSASNIRTARSAIVAIEPTTMRELSRHEYVLPSPPDSDLDSHIHTQLGDICEGKNTLYVSDASSRSVLQLPNYEGDLRSLSRPRWLGSPQGIAEHQDATAILVADYSSGLHRIDLKTDEQVKLLPPTNSFLIGIDGIYRYKNDLIAIQNGSKPDRVLRIKLNGNWTEIESVDVLLQNDQYLSDPTTGVIVGDSLYFVARSQWPEFSDDGKPTSAMIAPTVIGRVRLQP